MAGRSASPTAPSAGAARSSAPPPSRSRPGSATCATRRRDSLRPPGRPPLHSRDRGPVVAPPVAGCELSRGGRSEIRRVELADARAAEQLERLVDLLVEQLQTTL